MKDDLICPACHLGHLDLQLSTYVRQYGETLISVPGTPARVCDVCHTRQFDPAAIQRIETLVGQAGPPPNRYRPARNPKIARRADKPAATTITPTNKAKVK